jgi:hypothetical protein
VEWIALSFVRKADEVHELKELIRAQGKKCLVVSKIEKPEAIANIDAIIEASDAVMVARGDLGVEVPMEDVPMLQKMIVEKCNKLAKPVIIATQMLESMITSPRPTRAETSDVANSVLDGADVVMLSAESASGQYPLQAVQAMNDIIRKVEETAESVYYRNNDHVLQHRDENFLQQQRGDERLPPGPRHRGEGRHRHDQLGLHGVPHLQPPPQGQHLRVHLRQVAAQHVEPAVGRTGILLRQGEVQLHRRNVPRH